MRKRTDDFETFAVKTYVLDSGRTVFVYPLSGDENLLPIKQLTKFLNSDLKEINDLLGLSSIKDMDNMNSAALQAAALASYALLALCLDDPEYVFDTEIPENTIVLNPEQWFEFSSKISTECRSRHGRMLYTDSDRNGIVSLAREAIRKTVEEEKKT